MELSEFIDRSYGFVPIVFPITEPAIGYGAGGGLMFIHTRGTYFEASAAFFSELLGGDHEFQRVDLVAMHYLPLDPKWTWNNFEQFEKSLAVVTGGTGFRYELAREYGLHMGVDVAFGPDDPVVYVQVGSAWMRP